MTELNNIYARSNLHTFDTYVLFCLAKSTFRVMNDPTIWRGPGHENVYPSFLIELLASITFIKFSSALLASFDL